MNGAFALPRRPFMVGWPATVARVCGSVSIITDRVVSHAPWAPPVLAPVRELFGEIADCKYIHTLLQPDTVMQHPPTVTA